MTQSSLERTPDEGVVERFGYQQELKRTLGLKELVIYGMVFMAPLAPMQVYGQVAQQSFGMAPLVYIVGVIAMLFTAMSYRAMSREFPIAGSVYSYIQRALHPRIGFLSGWLLLSDYILVPGLLYAFVGTWMAAILPSVPAYVWALLFIIINTMINVRGITVTARVNFLMFWLQIAALVAFVGVTVNFVFVQGHGTGGMSLAPVFQADHFDLGFIASAATFAVLGFIGFDGISTLSEEAKNPETAVGRATVMSLAIIGVLFLVQAYLAALVHPAYDDLNPDMGFFDIAQEAGGSLFYTLLILVNVVSVGIAVSLNVQSATSRVLYSMSRDNLLPFSSMLRKVHPKYQTPAGATYFSALVAIVILFAMKLDTIIQFVSFGATTAFMMLNLSVFIYFFVKKKRRGLRGSIQYLLCPLLGFGIVAYVWSGFDTITFYVGLGWLILGVIVGMFKGNEMKKLKVTLSE
jgi:amino acid transporter